MLLSAQVSVWSAVGLTLRITKFWVWSATCKRVHIQPEWMWWVETSIWQDDFDMLWVCMYVCICVWASLQYVTWSMSHYLIFVRVTLINGLMEWRALHPYNVSKLVYFSVWFRQGNLLFRILVEKRKMQFQAVTCKLWYHLKWVFLLTLWNGSWSVPLYGTSVLITSAYITVQLTSSVNLHHVWFVSLSWFSNALNHLNQL